jgi:hypothetical protein
LHCGGTFYGGKGLYLEAKQYVRAWTQRCKCSQLKVKYMFKVLSGKTLVEKQRRENL